MNAVLYTHDGQPITILDLPIKVHQIEYRVYRIPVPMPIGVFDPDDDYGIAKPLRLRTVDISVDLVWWFDRRTGERTKVPLFTTADEEDALILRSVFLPGQNAEVQERVREAMAEGFSRRLLG